MADQAFGDYWIQHGTRAGVVSEKPREPNVTTTRRVKSMLWSSLPRAERDNYDFSPGCAETLKEYDGKYLPVVKGKFPIESNIAVISVVTTWDERAQTLRRRSAAR